MERKYNHGKTADNESPADYGRNMEIDYFHAEIDLFGLPNNLHPSRTCWAMEWIAGSK